MLVNLKVSHSPIVPVEPRSANNSEPTASGDYAQLVECKIITLNTEKRPLAEQVIKKIKLAAKTFLLTAISFVVLNGLSKDSPRTIPLRCVAGKGGLCFNPPGRVARLAGRPCLHVNRV